MAFRKKRSVEAKPRTGYSRPTEKYTPGAESLVQEQMTPGSNADARFGGPGHESDQMRKLDFARLRLPPTSAIAESRRRCS